MATIKAMLYTSKTLSNGDHPIMLRISSGDERKYISLGFSCSELMWDAKASLPRRKHEHFYDIQALIQKKKEELTNELYKIKFDEKKLNINSLVKKARRGGKSKVKLLEYFEEVYTGLLKKGRVGYSGIFKYVRSSISNYLDAEDLLLSEVTTEFLEGYEQWLIERGVSITTRSVYFRTFRTLYRYAMKDELVSTENYPFKNFAFAKYNDPESKPRSISKLEIQKVFNLQLKEGSKAFHSLNYFKFSYYASLVSG